MPGIRENQDDADSAIDTELALADAERLLATLPAPSQPTDTAFYLQHCVRACEGGVERSHILPFAVDGALLLEVFTHDGIGTMVVDEKLESLREATSDDVGGILQLIEPFERDGTLVKRDRTEIERDIGNYTVIEHDGVIFGCAALYPVPRGTHRRDGGADGVAAGRRARATARRILKRVEQRAKAQGLDSIFVLTTRTMHWFIKRGFAAGRPRLAARGAQAQVQLGPALAGAGQETRLSRSTGVQSMARMVQCVYLKKEAEGLVFAPYPGELGKRIYDNVSKEAFDLWKKHQTMLVNENRLNLADAARPPVPGAADGAVLLRRRRRQAGGLRAADELIVITNHSR